MKFFKHIILAYILLNIPFVLLKSQNKNHEIRAVWLTSNWNLDWPLPRKTSEQQKKDLSRILDQLQEANFNTVFFQVRIRGDVFYKSKIEPWSPFFKKEIKQDAFVPYDPLELVIQECHKRGIECHAWFVTFPLGSPKQVKSQGKQSVVSKHPTMCKLHQGEWYLDPGNPATKTYLLSLVNEIISNYDIDGIQFDYIRYPEAAKKFPDKDTFRKYGSGKSLEQWRRYNITDIVSDIHELVKTKKPWVQISCSPIGRYRNLDPMKGRWTAYESVHQDAGLWLQTGKMDAVYPMLYYNETDFNKYVDDWVEMSDGRIVVPGLGVYRLLSSEGDWDTTDITRQIAYSREVGSQGQAYYRAANILDNNKGIKDSLNNYYTYPAKLPPLYWLSNVAPNSPVDLQVYQNTDGFTVIEWQPADKTLDQTYTIYETSTEDCDINDSSKIVMTGIHQNKMLLKTEDAERGVYFSVTASDRFHNESVPSFPVFFVLSSVLDK